MQKEMAMKWIEALRSGKYKQGKNWLCYVKGKTAKYCCLGVLCHINKVPYEKYWDSKKYDGNARIISEELKIKLKMNTQSGQTSGGWLSEMNDNGKSFKEIANVIEKHYQEI